MTEEPWSQSRDGVVRSDGVEVRRRAERATVVYSNQWQRILRVPLVVDDVGRDLFITDYGRRAAVVVVRGDSVLMVRQYRYLIDRISWEIPGGRVDVSEAPEAAAARECAEETGVVCSRLEPLIFVQPGLDTLHNPTHLFVTQTSEGDPAPGHEALHAEWVPLERAMEWVWDGTVSDSLSVVGLLAYSARGGR